MVASQSQKMLERVEQDFETSQKFLLQEEFFFNVKAIESDHLITMRVERNKQTKSF